MTRKDQIHAWDIDSKSKDCCIVVIKREDPLVWHPYAVFLIGLPPTTRQSTKQLEEGKQVDNT